ncbi:hypothetical protein HPB52_019912 [Rhipicephalus sanguineus]|uniref:Uncharacterized protein n=1 Tax=Rhipicephalus sanguineus TaxID=34632 RepID=A0A9D4PXF1_RHISA|nr:hypothetical protein HPB52_019912 [Rhipicephalus sanguineus]
MNPFLYFMQIVLVGSTGLSGASVDGKTYGNASTDFTGGACADGFLCHFDGYCDQMYPPPSSTSSKRTTIRDGPSCNFFSGHVSFSPANMNPFLYFMQPRCVPWRIKEPGERSPRNPSHSAVPLMDLIAMCRCVVVFATLEAQEMRSYDCFIA